MKTVTINRIMDELQIIKNQNHHILEELEGIREQKELSPKFVNEIIERKNNESLWLSEKESEIELEKLKKRADV